MQSDLKIIVCKQAIRTTCFAMWITGVLVAVGGAWHAEAQAPSLRQAKSASVDLYVRYRPSDCAQAPRQQRQFLREREPDALPSAPFTDRLDKSTIEAVRACVARFSVATVAPDELLGLGAAYLAANEDVRADSAFRTFLKTQAVASMTDRAWALYRIVDLHMTAVPSRVASAKVYLAQLNALGAPAAAEQVLANLSIVTMAQVMDSLSLIQEHTAAAIAASKLLTGDSAKMYAEATARAYFARADLEVRHGDLAGARATVKEVLTIMTRVRPRVAADIRRNEAEWYALVGQTANPVRFTRMVPAREAVTRGTTSSAVIPEFGKPALLVFVSTPCGFQGVDWCYPYYVVLRRLLAKHPGLSVTLVTRTEGSYRGRLVSADSEMTLVGDFFHRVLEISAPLAIWQTNFDRRADRYMMARPTPNDSAYHVRELDRLFFGPPRLVLVDVHGVIRRVAVPTPRTETMLNRELDAIQQ